MKKPAVEPSARSRLLRSVFVLVGGTALGHLITALTLPVAARLYSPEDFSVLAVFSSMVAIVSVAAALRFDIAIPVTASDEDAANLLVLALMSSFAIALAVGGAAVALPDDWLQSMGLVPIAPYLWLLPLSIFLAAAYSALQSWLIRRSSFGLIAKSRVGQSASTAAGQICLGASGVAPFGLLVGHILNTTVGCLVLGYSVLRQEARLFSAVSCSSLLTTSLSYSRFPKYSTLEALCNSAAIQLPVIMIATLAVGPEAGFLLVAMAVMQAPMALIGTAVGQVYLSRAPEEYRKGNLASFTVDALGGLSKAGIGPLFFAAIVAPDAFALIFGESWRRAGEMVTWMTPWFVAQFLTSPLAMAIHVTGHQRMAMVLQILGLIIRISSVWFASFLANSFIVEIYALSGLVFYLGYLFIVLIVVGASSRGVLSNLSRGVGGVLAWGAMALVLLWLSSTFDLISLLSIYR